jgi:hypothetical protein
MRRLDQLSLFDLYNTLALGIDGTEMPSFADQLDDRQRWDVAAYIASFTAKPEAAKVTRPGTSPTWPARPRPKSPPTKARRAGSIPRPACPAAAGQTWPGAIARLHRQHAGQEPGGLPRRRP